MSQSRLLPLALILLAGAITFHAFSMLLGSSPTTIVQPVAAQSVGGDPSTGLYYLSRDTYVLTQSADGQAIYLWYYDHDPIKRNNKVEFVTGAQIN